jgi:RNA polymerase sigma-70 factor (ECF subfamily)
MPRIPNTGATPPLARIGAGLVGSKVVALPSIPDEQGLLERVAGGDKIAFEALYRIYFPRLNRFVDRMVRRPQLTCEIVNDTMHVVWRKAASYNGHSRLSTWIFGIAYRTALKALGRLNEPVEVLEDEPHATCPRSPDEDLIRRQDRRILDDAMSHLSAEHRAVIELAYYQDCACREIAQIVECPVDTVKSRMFYARRRLRVLLEARTGDLM